jgi:hypothetical protein
VKRAESTTPEKDRIAAEIRVLQRLRDRCPTSFVRFADEVEQRIRPLFAPPADPTTPASGPDSAAPPNQPMPSDDGGELPPEKGG